MAYRYISVETEGNQLFVRRECDLKDGTVGVELMQMPSTIFSIRAGEYGLDPVADKDAIWDIILHENEATHDYEGSHPHIVTAETLEDAAAQHLEICRAAKDKHDARPMGEGGKRHPSKATLVALHKAAIVDHQLIALHRDRMKHESAKERGIIARRKADRRNPMQIVKAQLLDEIRNREGV